MEEGSSDDEAYLEQAKATFGTPETRTERWGRQKSEKWAEELHQRAVRAVEATLDSQMDKTGIKRGPYRQGGSLAPRSIRRKAKQLRDEAELIGLPETALQKGLEHLKSQGQPRATERKRQLTIESFLKRKSQPNMLEEPTEVSSASDSDSQTHSRQKRHRSIVIPSNMEMEYIKVGAINSNPGEPSKPGEGEGIGMEMDESPQAPSPGQGLEDLPSASESVGSGQESTNSDSEKLENQEIEDNEVAEWVDVVTEESSQQLSWRELEVLAEEGLKKARKRQDYSSEVLFAALSDFYAWVGRQGRGAAALRAARARRRGPAFA
ncbi:hypothetical protein M407DRAFT_31742 [Tulasnella calospora MUT 4182]|uniref:Uncharacterized protein n=1 Tax=Tulasnella calospora MUT 4182 TaxID=1051891 RepID=A0A0C3Q5Z1_9AGAM|nr:hypothetical protein M407DRAFT_31742 [Tulasnella calospora MUT 4182]